MRTLGSEGARMLGCKNVRSVERICWSKGDRSEGEKRRKKRMGSDRERGRVREREGESEKRNKEMGGKE